MDKYGNFMDRNGFNNMITNLCDKPHHRDWVYVTDILEKFDKEQDPKRNPDSNGILPLTEEELKEFEKMVTAGTTSKVQVTGINCLNYDEDGHIDNIDEFRAVEWLLRRFNLEEKNDKMDISR